MLDCGNLVVWPVSVVPVKTGKSQIEDNNFAVPSIEELSGMLRHTAAGSLMALRFAGGGSRSPREASEIAVRAGPRLENILQPRSTMPDPSSTPVNQRNEMLTMWVRCDSR